MATHDDGKPKSIKSVETAFDIVELVRTEPGLGVSDIAERLDYSKSTIHYYLGTLKRRRFLVEEDGSYEVGLRFLLYGGHARARQDLYRVSGSTLADLTDEVEGTAWMAIEQGDRCVFIRRAGDHPTEGPIGTVGTAVALHTNAYGKALLSALPDERVDEVLERCEMQAVTSDTVTDRATLDRHLDLVEDHGIAFDDCELADGYRSIAAPIVDEASGQVYGAVGVTCPVDRIEDPFRHSKARRFVDGPAEHVRRAATSLTTRLSD